MLGAGLGFFVHARIFKSQLLAAGSLPHSTCRGDADLWGHCSVSASGPSSQRGKPRHKMIPSTQVETGTCLGVSVSLQQLQPSLIVCRNPTCGIRSPPPHGSGERRRGCCPATPSASPQTPTPTPGANSVIHTRGVAVDHPLPLEGPAVNQSQLLFRPPERQENDSNTQPKPAGTE